MRGPPPPRTAHSAAVGAPPLIRAFPHPIGVAGRTTRPMTAHVRTRKASAPGRLPTTGIRQGHDRHPKTPGDGSKWWIGRREVPVQRLSRSEGDTIGEGKRSQRAMVVRGAEPTRGSPDALRDVQHFDTCGNEPVDLLDHLVRRSTSEADEHVDHFGFIHRREHGPVRVVSNYRHHEIGGWLPGQERDNRLRVEDSQRAVLRRSASASSARMIDRVSSVDGPGPASEPRAAVRGSSGRGLITRLAPRSSSRTTMVPHRCLISAGTWIWPPLEIRACLMRASLSHESRCPVPGRGERPVLIGATPAVAR
jgi:hypothetical protein